MNKLLECTRGPWETLADASHPANVRVRATLRLHIAKVYASDTGRDPVCQANAALIAAAFDHALIGQALVYGSLNFEWGNDGVEWFHSDDTVSQPIEIDSFGFPVLTDDLRARLILEMEAAK